mmetsp:Transcript_16453/g.47278  ORF Transcript_16453/g.47278 Transcript_16453/m.47278 type:complete len:314 (-) Transcript_16453:272-1213(-)
MTVNTAVQNDTGRGRYSNDSQSGWFQSHFAVVFGATIASSSAILMAMLLAPSLWASGTSGGLIGETVIGSPEAARSYADMAIEEAVSIWDEPRSNWEVVQNTPKSQDKVGLFVEARRITEGPLASSGVMLTRAEGILRLGGRRTADEVFDFLSSPEGHAVIDPDSDPDEYSETLLTVPGWPKGRKRKGTKPGSLEVAGSSMQGKEFVSLNAVNPTRRMFVSKSVLHNDKPGSSRYFEDGDASHNEVFAKQGNRGINTFAVEIDDIVEDNGKEAIKVRMIKYADLMPPHRSFMNWSNCKFFFPGVFKRLRESMK